MAETQTTEAPTNGQIPAPTADARAALIAELEAMEKGEEATPVPSEPPPAAEEKPDEETPDDSDTETDEPAEEPPTAAAEEEVDPKLAKNLEAIQRAEKRRNEKLDQREREINERIQAIEKDLAPRLERMERIEKLLARAEYDPAALLEAANIDLSERGESIARAVYARSKAAAANPQTREAAERALREREQRDTLGTLQTQIDELRQELQQRDERESQARAAEQYLAKVEKAVSDETPLAKTLFTKNPAKARRQFSEIALEIWNETGEEPDHADVIAEYEKRRRAELEELGIDAPGKASPKTSSPPKTNGKTLSNQLGSPAKPPPSNEPKTRDQIDAELIAELKAMDRS